MFGLSDQESEQGVPIRRFVAAIHPADRAVIATKRGEPLQDGHVIVVQVRTIPTASPSRWILVRGRYEVDALGQVTRGRGIVVDVTGSRQPRAAPAWSAEAPHPDDAASESALDRAAEHTLAARRAIDDLGTRARGLRPAVDALLLELGRRLAAVGAARKGETQ